MEAFIDPKLIANFHPDVKVWSISCQNWRQNCRILKLSSTMLTGHMSKRELIPNQFHFSRFLKRQNIGTYFIQLGHFGQEVLLFQDIQLVLEGGT